MTSIDFLAVIEPIEEYLLSCDSERKFFSDPGSISSCFELLETFCDRALQSDYSPWESFNVHGYDNNRTELEKSHKTVRIPNDMKSSSSLGEPVFISVKLLDQRRRPAEGPRVDI